MHCMYAPGGTGYERARAEFELCVSTVDKEDAVMVSDLYFDEEII